MKRLKRTSHVRKAEVIEVVVTRGLAGTGTDEDPEREVTEYWTKDGKFLFMQDILLGD